MGTKAVSCSLVGAPQELWGPAELSVLLSVQGPSRKGRRMGTEGTATIAGAGTAADLSQWFHGLFFLFPVISESVILLSACSRDG